MRALSTVLILLGLTQSALAEPCAFTSPDGICYTPQDVAPIRSLRKGMPYAQVRRRLLQSGYTPGRVPGNDTVRCDGPCTTPPEMLACSGSTMACRFLLERGPGKHYVIHTTGPSYRYAGATLMGAREYAAVMARSPD